MESTKRYLCVAAVLFSVLLSPVHSYTITVDAHAEECVFENVKAGTKLGLTFDVVEGGFLDIDVTITGPDGTVIYHGERETSGTYAFAAQISGRYIYCFSNKISTLTSKVVVFNLEVGDAPQAEAVMEGDHNKLDHHL